MKLKLRSLNIHDDISRETLCFSATIYVNGKKVGSVLNDGQGGCHTYEWDDRALGERIEAWAYAQTEFGLDDLIDDLIPDE